MKARGYAPEAVSFPLEDLAIIAVRLVPGCSILIGSSRRREGIGFAELFVTLDLLDDRVGNVFQQSGNVAL